MSDFPTRRVMMVDTQVRPSDVTKFPIIAAMLSVPRENFVPVAQREAAYAGLNITISPRRVVLEARTLAKLLDVMDIQPGETVLDVAAGLGYTAAILSKLGANVVAAEADAGLAAQASAALSAEGYGVQVVSDAAGTGPFDAIVIDGAVEQVPAAVLDLLKDGGRIGAIFMTGALGVAKIGFKQDGVMSWRYAFNATAPVLPGFESAREFVF